MVLTFWGFHRSDKKNINREGDVMSSKGKNDRTLKHNQIEHSRKQRRVLENEGDEDKKGFIMFPSYEMKETETFG